MWLERSSDLQAVAHNIIQVRVVRQWIQLVFQLQLTKREAIKKAEGMLTSDIHNHGAGTQNVNTGEGTQNNNTGSGKQYIGTNQHFG